MGCLGGCLGRKGQFLLIYKIDCQLSKPDIAYRGVVGSSLRDLAWRIVIVCVPQTAVGVVINALSLIESFLFTLFSIVSPSFCIFALKYRLNSGAFYWK